MRKVRVDPERLNEALLNTLLFDAFRDMAAAFARADSKSSLHTIAAIEDDIHARIDGFETVMAKPRLAPALKARLINKIACQMATINRAAEEASPDWPVPVKRV